MSVQQKSSHEDFKKTFYIDDETIINYEIHGNGPSVIIFLHGFGASLESWRDIAPELSRNNTIYLIDLKGFGNSSKPPDNKYSLQNQADIIYEFIRSTNLSNTTIVGHSYGGAVVLLTYLKAYLENERKLISRLVLIDAAGYIQKIPFFISYLQKPILNWIIMNLVPSTLNASYTLHHLFYDKSLVKKDRIKRYSIFFNKPGAYHSFVASAKQILPSDPEIISSRIRSINIPTLIIWGIQDPIIPVEQAYRFNNDIPNSTLELIPGCGHIPHEEKPKLVINYLKKFREK